MSKKIVQRNAEAIKEQLKESARSSVEGPLADLLEQRRKDCPRHPSAATNVRQG